MSAEEALSPIDNDPRFAVVNQLVRKLQEGDSETADYMFSKLDFLLPEREDK